LLPFSPDSAEKILALFDAGFSVQGFSWVGRKDYGLLKTGQVLGDAGVMFPKLLTAG
jgi:hypothetical protein